MISVAGHRWSSVEGANVRWKAEIDLERRFVPTNSRHSPENCPHSLDEPLLAEEKLRKDGFDRCSMLAASCAVK